MAIKAFVGTALNRTYDQWAQLQIAWVGDAQYPVVAMNNALISDMIFTQPVVYELNLIKAPTLLIIGSLDRTAINKDLVKDPALKAQMGQYPQLAKQAQQQIKGSQLIMIDGVGHLPHIKAFERFVGVWRGLSISEGSQSRQF